MEIFAHRGASGNAPQNTISAFKLAVEQKVDGIELDVQLTKDGEVVIYHDWDICNYSNGKGEIGDLTLEELKQYDFGAYFSDEFKNEKIPTLDEVLDIVPENIILNIELKIKAYNTAPLVEKTVEVLKRRGRFKNILVSSFDHDKLKQFKVLLPEVTAGILYVGKLIDPLSYIEGIGLEISSFNLHCDYVSEEIVIELKKRNVKIYIWTVNDAETAKKMYSFGVDGIMTNYPNEMQNLKYK